MAFRYDWLKDQSQQSYGLLDKISKWLNKPLLPEKKNFWEYDPEKGQTLGSSESGVYNFIRALSAPKDLTREAAALAFPPARIPVAASYFGESVLDKDPIGAGISAIGIGGLAAARKFSKTGKVAGPIAAANEPTGKIKNPKYWRGLEQSGDEIIEVGKMVAKDGKITMKKLAGSTIWKGLKAKEYTPEMLDDDMLKKAFRHYNKNVAIKTTNYKRLSASTIDRSQQLSALQEGLAYKRGAYSQLIPNFGGKKGKGFKEAYEDFANADRQAQRSGDDELKKRIRKSFNKYLRDKGYVDKGGKFARDDIRQVMTNYYDRGRSWSLFRNFLAPLAQTSKQLILSSGLPGTGVNWFGSGMLMRSFIDPKGRVGNTARMLFNPEEGARIIKANKDQIPRLVRAGLDFSAADNIDAQVAKLTEKTLTGISLKSRNKADQALKFSLKKLDDWFGEPLFARVIPAMKVQSALAHEKANLARGMKPRQALKEAVRTANGFYSGSNWKALVKVDKNGKFSSRSPEFNDFLRSVFLAPSWLESNIRIGKGALTLKTAEGRAYRRAVGVVMGMYVTASASQKASVGHFMHENAPGKRFDLQLPGKTSNKKNRYVPLGLGTAADFARLPTELAQAVMNDRKDPLGSAMELLRNRVSAPLSASINVLANTDYRGDPLTGRDRFGRDIPFWEGVGNQATELFGTVTPQQMKAGIDYGRGRSNLEEALVEGFELPLRYRRPWVDRRASGGGSRRRRRRSSRRRRR